MDLKEIIKWFIPCFHILLIKFKRMDTKLTLLCIFLFFNCGLSHGASFNSVKLSLSDNKFYDTKNVGLLNEQNIPKLNQSDVLTETVLDEDRSVGDSSIGRTFGRPLKKMMSALIPLIFQIGAASTWAVVAALVGIKTLVVTLVILKLLLVAGAAKAGALFVSKGHQHQPHGWEHGPPLQKEIHLHIHNGGQHTPHDEQIATWNRNEVQLVKPDKNLNMVIDPYSAGPQTISTPFGNYVRID